MNHQRTISGTRPVHKQHNKQNTKYLDADSDSEFVPGENDSGGRIALWSCRLCNIDKFLSQSSFNRHLSCVQHCQKYLRHQAFMGFEKFYVEFGAVPFGGNRADMPDEAVDIMNHMELMVYRSGIVNKMECRVCDIKCNTMTVWKQHINGKKHLKKCAEEMFKIGRERYLSQLGDLPIPDQDKLHDVLHSLERENSQGKKVNQYQQSKAKPIPILAKILKQQKQKEANRNWRPSQDWNISSAGNTDSMNRDEEIISIEDRKTDTISLLGPAPTSVSSGLLGSIPPSIVTRSVHHAVAASQVGMVDAALKQGAILTQVSQVPVISGTVPMIRSGVPAGLVMVPAHQIELARAQAQAQGLLPQSQPMPLQEQIATLTPTVPKKIDVRPTKDMAELHSELQKQLLGAEIVPPKADETENESTSSRKSDSKSKDDYYTEDSRKERSPHYRHYDWRDDDQSYIDERKLDDEQHRYYKDDHRQNTYSREDERKKERPKYSGKGDYKSHGDYKDIDNTQHAKDDESYDKRRGQKNMDQYKKRSRSNEGTGHYGHRSYSPDKSQNLDYSSRKHSVHSYSPEDREKQEYNYWRDNSGHHGQDKYEKYSDSSYKKEESRYEYGKENRTEQRDREKKREGNREKEYYGQEASKDHYDDRKHVHKYSDSKSREHKNTRSDTRSREHESRCTDSGSEHDRPYDSRRKELDDRWPDFRRKEHEDKWSDFKRKEHDDKWPDSRRKENDDRWTDSRRKEHDDRWSHSRGKEHEHIRRDSKRKENEDKWSESRRKDHDSKWSESRRKEHNDKWSESKRKDHDDKWSESKRKDNDDRFSHPKRREHDDRWSDSIKEQSKPRSGHHKEREGRSFITDESKHEHKGHRDTIHVRGSTSRSRREDSQHSHERPRRSRSPVHRSREDKSSSKDSKRMDHALTDDRYSRDYKSISVYSDNKLSSHIIDEDIDKPRDLREILEESRKTESIGSSDLRLKLSQKRIRDPDMEHSTSRDYDQRLEVDEPIVVEVGASDNRDTDYRKVYVPQEGPSDEDLRLHIERRHKDNFEHDSYRDQDDRYSHWDEHEKYCSGKHRDEDWREHMDQHRKYDQENESRQCGERRQRSDHYQQDCDHRKESNEEAVERRSHPIHDFSDAHYDHFSISEDPRATHWEGGEVEGGRDYKDGDYRRHSYRSDHRDRDERAGNEDFGEAGRRARSGMLDEEVKDKQSKRLDDEHELKGAMEIFSETLQQFIRMLHGTQQDRSEIDDTGDPFLDLSEEEIQAVRQVQQMTGISDMKVAANAMKVFNSMDPIMIQMIGQLGPESIKELMSGNSKALESLPNYDEIRTRITEGRINPHEMQDTMEKYGFAPRGHHSDYTTFGGRGWRGRGGDSHKRGWHGRGRGGPAAKRGRY